MGKPEMETIRRIAVGSLLGGAVGMVVLLMLCYLCAFLTVQGSIGQNLLDTLTTAIAFLGAAAGAVTAARYSRVRMLVSGIGGGLVFLLPLMVLTAVFCGGIPFGSVTMRLILCSLTGGLFGGALCLRRKPKRKSGRKRRTA